MQNETIGEPIIDPNLDSYEQFFDHDWCKRMFEAVETSPLKAAVNSLMVAWRSTNGSHRLPSLIIHILRAFAGGDSNGKLRARAGYFETVINGIADKIDSRMHLPLTQRTALKRVVGKIEREAHQVVQAAKSELPFEVERFWGDLTSNPEFAFCILGTQRMSYGALFFAYEDFLANVIRTKEPTYNSKSPIRDAFARVFSVPLRDYCWSDPEVDLAKLVRHALVHNDGRFGTDLERYRDRFIDADGVANPPLQGDLFNVKAGQIQITPCNTRHLFGVLSVRVTKIVTDLG